MYPNQQTVKKFGDYWLFKCCLKASLKYGTKAYEVFLIPRTYSLFELFLRATYMLGDTRFKRAYVKILKNYCKYVMDLKLDSCRFNM